MRRTDPRVAPPVCPSVFARQSRFARGGRTCSICGLMQCDLFQRVTRHLLQADHRCGCQFRRAERLVGACPKTRPRYRGSVHSTEEIACQSQEVVVVGPFDTNWPSKNCQSPTPAIAMTAKPGAAAPLPSMLCYRRRYCRSQAKLANFPLMPENASPRSILPVLPVRPGWPIVMLQFPAWWFYAPALWTAATNSSLRFIFGRSASSDGLPFQNQHHPSMKRQARPSLRPPCRAKFSWSEAVVPEAGQSLP